MERRRFERKTISLRAERISGNENHAVFIENISENGIYLVTASSNSTEDFTPQTTIDLKLTLTSGESLNLLCRVIWSYRMPPEGLTSSIGMEVIDPPLEYKEFVRNLP